eukprot:COSAG01_NODE_331_length_18718_cov_21.881358_7_plen_109_part_00
MAARAQDATASPASSYQPGAAADDSYEAADVSEEAPSPPPAGALEEEAAELLHAPPSPDAMSAISGTTGETDPWVRAEVRQRGHLIEAPWSHLTSECQRLGHPPPLDK